jgi:undecaprenyl-diphosphatase
LWFIGSGSFDLAPDEAHYWTWSKRLDWGYYSKGPMVAYLIALSTRLGGDTEFFVRLPAVLLSAGTAILTFRLARRLSGSEQVGLNAALLLGVMPLTSAGSILMTIDAPLIFFWVLALFATHRALEANDTSSWALAGVALGLGLLSKYTMAVIVPQIAAYLALSGRHRRAIRRPGPYLALATGLLLLLPVLRWNWTHDWVSFRHLLGQIGPTNGSLSPPASLAQFLGSQVAFVTPFLFLLLLIGMWHVGRTGLGRGGDDAALFLLCTSVPLLLLCAAVSLWTKVQANWAAPAYIAAAIAAAIWQRQSSRRAVRAGRARNARTLFAVALVTGLLVTFVGHFPASLAWLGAPLPPRLDPTRRLSGWKDLGRRVGDVYLEMSKTRPTFMLSDSYQTASELMFYVPGHPQAYNIALGRRMNQFDVWGGTAEVIGWDAIFVTASSDDPPLEVTRSFNGIERHPVNEAAVHAEGRVARPWSIFRCYGFKGFPPPQIHGY